MVFGVKKQFIIISALILAFNMFVAIHTYRPDGTSTFGREVIHFLFPLGVAMLGGSLLGFVVMMFPTKQPITKEVRYVQSKIVGIMLVNAFLFLVYIYRLYYFYAVTNG